MNWRLTVNLLIELINTNLTAKSLKIYKIKDTQKFFLMQMIECQCQSRQKESCIRLYSTENIKN